MSWAVAAFAAPAAVLIGAHSPARADAKRAPHLKATTGAAFTDAACPRGAGPVRVTGRFSTDGRATRAWFEYGNDFRGTRILKPRRTRAVHVRLDDRITACIVGIPYIDPFCYRLVLEDHGHYARGRIRSDDIHR